jgi:hypothetical protein
VSNKAFSRLKPPQFLESFVVNSTLIFIFTVNLLRFQRLMQLLGGYLSKFEHNIQTAFDTIK